MQEKPTSHKAFLERSLESHDCKLYDRVKYVPFYNFEEWYNVKNKLFSENILVQKHALDRLDVWKFRNPLHFPHTMACTMVFIRIEHRRITLEKRKKRKKKDTDSLRVQSETKEGIALEMAQAISKFVSGLSDLVIANQGSGGNKQPFRALLKSVFIPDFLISTRHKIVHGHTPPFEMLCIASSMALKWLKEHYWDQQEKVHKKYKQSIVDNIQRLHSMYVDFKHSQAKSCMGQFSTPYTYVDILNSLIHHVLCRVSVKKVEEKQANLYWNDLIRDLYVYFEKYDIHIGGHLLFQMVNSIKEFLSQEKKHEVERLVHWFFYLVKDASKYPLKKEHQQQILHFLSKLKKDSSKNELKSLCHILETSFNDNTKKHVEENAADHVGNVFVEEDVVDVEKKSTLKKKCTSNRLSDDLELHYNYISSLTLNSSQYTIVDAK